MNTISSTQLRNLDFDALKVCSAIRAVLFSGITLDSFDLSEEGIQPVLEQAGFCERLESVEAQLVFEELFKLACEAEFREAAYLASLDVPLFFDSTSFSSDPEVVAVI